MMSVAALLKHAERPVGLTQQVVACAPCALPGEEVDARGQRSWSATGPHREETATGGPGSGHVDATAAASAPTRRGECRQIDRRAFRRQRSAAPVSRVSISRIGRNGRYVYERPRGAAERPRRRRVATHRGGRHVVGDQRAAGAVLRWLRADGCGRRRSGCRWRPDRRPVPQREVGSLGGDDLQRLVPGRLHLRASVVCNAHQTSWSAPAVSMKPRMSSTAQSTLPPQPRMSLGPMLATITGGSKPAARWW